MNSRNAGLDFDQRKTIRHTLSCASRDYFVEVVMMLRHAVRIAVLGVFVGLAALPMAKAAEPAPPVKPAISEEAGMNIMSEFMGLIYGVYDAKPGGGFEPGGFSLHNTMLPHGPDAAAFEGASSAELKPHKQEGTMAFMFETRFMQRMTAYAANLPELQQDYGNYGQGLRKLFDPNRRDW